MKKKLIVLSGFGLSLVPFVALAATAVGVNSPICTGGQVTDLGSLLCKIKQLLDTVVPVLIAFAVVYFVWGIISYVIGGDEEAKKKGRDKIIAGVIGLAVIIGMWGLVNILTKTFGIDNTGTINLPVIQ